MSALEEIRALVNKSPVIWSCSHCGPHTGSKANWCAAGCGRDYNRMTGCVVLPVELIARALTTTTEAR